MRLEELLLDLSSQGRTRALVRATLVCLEQQLPRALVVDRTNAELVRVAAQWLVGSATPEEVRATAERAGSVRGGVFTSVPIRSIGAPHEVREELLRRFALQLPTAVWFASPEGDSWKAKHSVVTPVGSDPAALEQVAGVEARLVERARDAAAGRASSKLLPTGACDPTARFEATAELSSSIFERGFDPSRDAALRVATRDRGPVRIFAVDASPLAELAPPPQSWSFGAQLSFASHGDELFVAVPDLDIIQTYGRAPDDQWHLRATIEVPHQRWAEHREFVRVNDDHLWSSEVLFRRVGSRWERCAQCARPLAATADLTEMVCGETSLQLYAGQPYEWPEPVKIELPTNACATRARFDGSDRLVLVVEGAEVSLERREGIGWVQVESAPPSPRLRIEQAPPGLALDAVEPTDAEPWVLGAAYAVGTWIRHPRFGLGLVTEHDRGRETLEVQFREGKARKLKVR